MTCLPAGDDPIPATVFGTCSKSLGALELLIRGVGTCCAPVCLGRRHGGDGFFPCSQVGGWLTCLVRTTELGDYEESSTLAWAWH
jgi:hypothetical protein